MADGRGKETARAEGAGGAKTEPESLESRGAIPDLVRRALSIGLSGLFLTEETIRKAIGDSLPRDWTDFAVEQSGRTRAEFLERLSFEIGRALENVDVAAVLRDLLEGRTLEVRAEIRLGDRGEKGGAARVRVAPAGREKSRR